MYCQKCGAENDDNAFKCTSCGTVLQTVAQHEVSREYVPSYLAPAILLTLFCCLPFGIVAIVYAAQVNGKASAGDIQGAWQSSENAKTWCWISFWSGLGVAILWTFFALESGV
jgi:hypothetical protein